MLSAGGDMVTTIFMLLASLAAVVLSNDRKYCDNYLLCAHQLEVKQRQCIELEERRSAKLRAHPVVGSCEKTIHEARSAIHGLELRKTEMNRDCVRKNIASAESIMDPALEGMCSKLADKFMFSNKPSKLWRTTKRGVGRKGDVGRKRVQECRHEAKAWHKQCRRLAKCCSVLPECALESVDVQTQISKQRWRLESTKGNCPPKNA